MGPGTGGLRGEGSNRANNLTNYAGGTRDKKETLTNPLNPSTNKRHILLLF